MMTLAMFGFIMFIWSFFEIFAKKSPTVSSTSSESDNQQVVAQNIHIQQQDFDFLDVDIAESLFDDDGAPTDYRDPFDDEVPTDYHNPFDDDTLLMEDL